ncbi:hypothetical protein L9F63_005742, partial [Diploptera punctata]
MDKIAILRESCARLGIYNFFEILGFSKEHFQRHITTLGSGAGKGGGGGGSIRDAGGKLGEMGAAREEEYFRRKNAELLEKLKSATRRDIEHHKRLIASYTKSMEEMYAKLKKMSQDEMGSEEMKRERQQLESLIESHKKALKHAEHLLTHKTKEEK